jgi:hypothetical protein
VIEGRNPRHVCIDLAHYTSQSKIFDTSGFLQFLCQVLLMVMLDVKSLVKTAVEDDPHGMTAIPTAPPLCTNCLRVSVISITSKV